MIFEYFCKIYSRRKVVEKDGQPVKFKGRDAEGNDPNAIYCYDVQRNGRRKWSETIPGALKIVIRLRH